MLRTERARDGALTLILGPPGVLYTAQRSRGRDRQQAGGGSEGGRGLGVGGWQRLGGTCVVTWGHNAVCGVAAAPQAAHGPLVATVNNPL